MTDPLGNHTDYIYNALDQPTSVRDERANQTTLSYDIGRWSIFRQVTVTTNGKRR